MAGQTNTTNSDEHFDEIHSIGNFSELSQNGIENNVLSSVNELISRETSETSVDKEAHSLIHHYESRLMSILKD